VHLTPQFGASFCVTSLLWAILTALMGAIFGALASKGWGRKLLLAHPRLFTLGAFSEAGPTQAMLDASSFRTVFYGAGWADGSDTSAPFDKHVMCSVSGPEPGYVATSLMFVAVARAVLEDRKGFGVQGGVFTPGGLVGSGGPTAVIKLIKRCNALGVNFEVGSAA